MSQYEEFVKYLKTFGYLDGKDLTPEDIAQATKEFQEAFGIDADGETGVQTIRASYYPRCGMKDVEFITEDATGISRWGIPRITWYIEDYLEEFSKEEMTALIKRGFDFTSSKIQVDFAQVTSSNKANIVFTSSGSPKDEMGKASGVLAWCELPPRDGFDGQIVTCFDTAELWIGDRGGRGIRYFNVLMHEVCWGHGMGLSHSKKSECLMSPFYSPDIAYPVEPDDETEMYKRYKKRVGQPPTPPVDPKPQPNTVTIKLEGTVTNIEIPGYRITKLPV